MRRRDPGSGSRSTWTCSSAGVATSRASTPEGRKTMTDELPAVCDLIVRNGYVLTMNAERRIFPRGAVAVRGHTIVAVGDETEVLRRWRATRVIDAGGGIVHPGFIDAHLHVNAQTCRGFFRGNASKAGT